MQEARELLEKEAYREIPRLYSGLLAYHQQLTDQLQRFAALYPAQAELRKAWQRDLLDYQDAVGALVEQAWRDADRLLAQVSENLSCRLQLAESVRCREGFSRLPELDELAWSLHHGHPDAEAVRRKLEMALQQVADVLVRNYPDPRLQMEWADLWEPRGAELSLQLAHPQLGLLSHLEDYFERLGHWLQRAAQRRDFGALTWWRDLRQDLILQRTESAALLSARQWLASELGKWPEADRQLRAHYRNETSQWLDNVQRCLAASQSQSIRALVAFGDLHYDRWLWLQSKA